MNTGRSVRDQCVLFCAAVGTDPLLVQGAGGNVSWKDGETLWIKASGTWLADAAKEDIFVATPLAPLRTAVSANQFDITAMAIAPSTLRPSIETLLHAIMPHRIVVHLHAIEVLSHLVRRNWQESLAAAMPQNIAWKAVPYAKPGAPLAQAVAASMAGGATNVLFLQSHGVVLGADDIEGIATLLETLTSCLRNTPLPASQVVTPVPAPSPYAPVQRAEVHALAIDEQLYDRLASEWALYPDHVVFLGARAPVFENLASLDAASDKPELAIVRGAGVYATPAFGLAKQVQLDCYFDVLVRQRPEHVLSVLSDAEIGQLLNWDSEQYRMRLAK